jgi:hypothetical protein
MRSFARLAFVATLVFDAVAVADAPVVRWVVPADAKPQGRAPGAKSKLLATHPDGERSWALILGVGDDVPTALADFARANHVVSAQFSAIGGVRDAEVAWFDPARKEFRAVARAEQMEVIGLIGDIALGADGAPVVHAHLTLARRDGSTWGGHLLRASVWPTLELFVTTFATPLHKRADGDTGIELIDPSLRD